MHKSQNAYRSILVAQIAPKPTKPKGGIMAGTFAASCLLVVAYLILRHCGV